MRVIFPIVDYQHRLASHIGMKALKAAKSLAMSTDGQWNSKCSFLAESIQTYHGKSIKTVISSLCIYNWPFFDT